MTRFSKVLKDGVFFGAFLILGSMIIAKIDLDQDIRIDGPFFAIDGDTLVAGAERLRLFGIDAPEGDQTCGGADGKSWTCGVAAREALARLAGNAQATCSGSTRDRYGRLIVQCRSSATDINAELVRQGMAIAAGGFTAEEDAARQAKSGIWSGTFDRPRDWRAGRGMAEEAPPANEGGAGMFDWLKGLLP